ncbi:YjgN family protein [Sneathiella marina]|uniref:YjgN family protein n=1 Tax=Sneathiella marina TaxID=2950108 RepID=A0ABY4W4D4_9PROT|nr:DUF898 family protein [Sneathiella marina]USG60154.1 YjgN family protein [Sneathiella marina]
MVSTVEHELVREGSEHENSEILFSISRKQLLIRLIKNKIFSFLTLGIYRFWAKTHIRRILWHGVIIKHDRLEYLGRAKELFIGFLIAMIILMPIMLAAGLITDLLAVAGPDPLIVGQVLNFVFLYFFWQFARYRLWRYRLSRTSWRGIRFFLTGSGFNYALYVLLWTIATIATLGWAYPWLQAFRLNYQLKNTQFGDTWFTYQGTAKGLFRIYWPAILVTQAILGLSGYYLYSVEALEVTAEATPILNEEIFASDQYAGWILGIGGLVVFLTLSVLSFAVRVWEFRYLVEKTSFATARFSSSLTIQSILSIFLLLLALAFVGYFGFAAVIYYLLILASDAGIIILMIGFFAAYIAYDIVKMLFLIVPLVEAVCKSIEISNIDAFEHAAASARKSPKYGEGFADALDVGAF